MHVQSSLSSSSCSAECRVARCLYRLGKAQTGGLGLQVCIPWCHTSFDLAVLSESDVKGEDGRECVHGELAPLTLTLVCFVCVHQQKEVGRVSQSFGLQTASADRSHHYPGKLSCVLKFILKNAMITDQ